MTKEEANQLLARTAAALGEHFGAVQILASMPVPGGGTQGFKYGSGDWYARQGLAHAFIHSDQADELSDQIARKLDPPDDAEAWKA